MARFTGKVTNNSHVGPMKGGGKTKPFVSGTAGKAPTGGGGKYTGTPRGTEQPNGKKR